MADKRGLLINTRTREQVDLFLVNHEEVSIQNKISGDGNIDISRIDEHVEMYPAEITIDGKLLPSKYDRSGGSKMSSGDDLSGQPLDKMKTLIRFANDAKPETSFNFHAPSLPFKTYLDYYITNFTYSNEGSSNAVTFNLTLEEIGMFRELGRGVNAGGGGSNALRGKKEWHDSTNSRFHTSIASSTEDGGGQVERGAPSISPLNDALTVENLEERVENKESQVIPKGSSKMELISRLIGSEEELEQRSTVLSLVGYPNLSIGEHFEYDEVSGDLGIALNQELGGISFPSTSKITNKELSNKNIISNIPNIGNVLNSIKGVPKQSEYLLEANRNQQSTVLFTMNSAVMRKLRSYIIDIGGNLSNGMSDTIKNDTILSDNENRILKRTFNEGINELMMRSREYSSLGSFITTLPKRSAEESLTYYNYYGQPTISFEGIVQLNFNRWSTQYITINGEEYEFETYWNKHDFPVCSVSQTDGSEIITQSRAFLGSDLLSSAQHIPNLNGVHIVPFSISNESKIKKDNINESIYFMIIHTNNSAINEVL